AASDACKGVQFGDYVEYLNDPHRDSNQDYWYMSVDFTPYGLVWQGRAWGLLDADKGQKQKWTIFLESDKRAQLCWRGHADWDRARRLHYCVRARRQCFRVALTQHLGAGRLGRVSCWQSGDAPADLPVCASDESARATVPAHTTQMSRPLV